MARIDELLTHLATAGGSDLHLSCGVRPHVRINGRLQPLPGHLEPLEAEGLESALHEIAPADAWEGFLRDLDADLAYELPGVGRFRANLFRQDNGPGAVFRMVPSGIRPLDSLGLPAAVERLAHLEHGLVLVAGPTGCGKSTTLAALIDAVNEHYARHIVTVEDPVEFVHRSKRSVVTHRELGAHSPDFATAIRGAMRQDADVLLVGELRDAETLARALKAAEMGMLVFATLHTHNAARTIDRIVDSFPSDQQGHVRASLADTLQAILAQVLIPSADGRGRVVALELLLRSSGVGNLIREAKGNQVASYIQSGRRLGMQTMDDALFKLVKDRRVLPGDAFRRAEDKTRFQPFLEGRLPSGRPQREG